MTDSALGEQWARLGEEELSAGGQGQHGPVSGALEKSLGDDIKTLPG